MIALQEEQCLVIKMSRRCGTDSNLPHPIIVLPDPVVWDQVYKETSGLAVVAECQE